MFFTKSARVVAILCLLFGVVNVFFGFVIALELSMPYETAVAQFGRSGPKIDRGIYTILFALALGTLAEISSSIRQQTAN